MNVEAGRDIWSPEIYLYVEKQWRSFVSVNVRLFDSNSQLDAGTEIPVVPEDRYASSRLSLLNVPIDGVSRVHLRLWAIRSFAVFHVVISDLNASELARFDVVPVADNPGDTDYPDFPWFPAYYGEVPNLEKLAPGASRINITVLEPTGEPFWGFVSVANNTTQHVTLVTPQ